MSNSKKAFVVFMIGIAIFMAAAKASRIQYAFKSRGKRPAKLLNYDKPLNKLVSGKNGISIQIDKSDYKLTILKNSEPIKQYPVVLGPNPVNDKLREGDGCTPEGEFKVKMKYPHARWSYFLWLNYPTSDSRRKHSRAKKDGKINLGSLIGGEIGIHGVPKGDDFLIDEGINWTAGCVSLKNEDVEEIYKYCSVGAVVTVSN